MAVSENYTSSLLATENDLSVPQTPEASDMQFTITLERRTC